MSAAPRPLAGPQHGNGAAPEREAALLAPPGSGAAGLSRRRLGQCLAGVAGAAGVTRAGAVAAHPDADLIRVCGEFYAGRAEEARLNALPSYGLFDPREEAMEVQLADLLAHMDMLIVRVADMTPITPDGLRAKATLLERTLPETVKNCEVTLETAEVQLALSLARDVLRFPRPLPLPDQA
jgi:hypothetical protein